MWNNEQSSAHYLMCTFKNNPLLHSRSYCSSAKVLNQSENKELLFSVSGLILREIKST